MTVTFLNDGFRKKFQYDYLKLCALFFYAYLLDWMLFIQKL